MAKITIILALMCALNAFVTYPSEGGPHPAIIFYMDAPGIREELRNMARRYARQGYYVILPPAFSTISAAMSARQP